MLHVGQNVKVQIIRINPETQRISLGMKQLDKDPWEVVADRYPIGAKVKGRVTNITDYGAFIELEDGIEGLVQDPYDRDAWIANLRRLASERALREALGVAARARAREFTWSKVGARRRALLLSALETRCR